MLLISLIFFAANKYA